MSSSKTPVAATSSKAPVPSATTSKPTPQFKQRKREVVTKHDPETFRDSLLNLISEDCDIEQYSQVLEGAADKLDYKRYADVLFEFLLTGGLIGELRSANHCWLKILHLLAPGGQIVDDGAKLNPFSIFECEDSLELIKQRVEVIGKLIRRYKYLQKKLEETLEHILQYVNKFGPNSDKLNKALGIMISTQLVSMNVLSHLTKEHLVKEGASLQFLTGVLQSYMSEQSVEHLGLQLKKSGLDQNLLDFFPPNKRQEEYLARHFEAEGLKAVVDFYKKRQGNNAKDVIKAQLKDMMEASKTELEVATFLKQNVKQHGWNEAETLALLFDSLMEVYWNSKAEQIEAQIIKSLTTWPKVLAAFCTSAKTEIGFLQRVQSICYEDARLTKHFRIIASNLYKHDVISDGAIIYWFEKGAGTQGKALFLKQMEPFIEFLKSQESDDEDEDE
ncbi:hypothetical protein HDU97_003506 [Phlyctochytrium planicorne]|nr:hypothetical protein HDU97_003506 [Phlyctochytrium planicorne]